MSLMSLKGSDSFEDEHLELVFKRLDLRNIHHIKPSKNLYLACNLVAISIIAGILYIYAAFVSKLLPDTGYWILDFIKHDYYYCYLVPLLLLPTYAVIWLNWIASQIYEHNKSRLRLRLATCHGTKYYIVIVFK
jgi:hypothetical protein